MSIRILTVPFEPNKQVFQDDELRSFLLNKHVHTISPHFFQINGTPYWSVFVEYDPLLTTESPAADALDEPERALYKKFQEWRKDKAGQEGVPVYIVATNKQLIAVVRHAPRSLEALRQVRGFGKKKLVKYGDEILTMIRAFYAKEPLHSAKPRQEASA